MSQEQQDQGPEQAITPSSTPQMQGNGPNDGYQNQGQGPQEQGAQGPQKQGAQGQRQGPYIEPHPLPRAGAGAGAVNASKPRLSENLGMHILMVFVISLLLLIPTLFFSFVLDDRQDNERNAISSMVSAWGSSQMLNDIELDLSVESLKQSERKSNSTQVVQNYVYQRMIVSPALARNDVNIGIEKRYRGNYEASLFNLVINQEARFNLAQVLEDLMARREIASVPLDDMYIIFTVSDTKGINEIKRLVINNKSFTPEPMERYSGFMVRLSQDDIAAILSGKPLPEGNSSIVSAAQSRYGDNINAGNRANAVPALHNSFDAAKTTAHQDETTVAVVGQQQAASNQAVANQIGQAAQASNASQGNRDFAEYKDLGLGLKGQVAPAGVMIVEATYLVRGSQKLTFNPVAQVSEFAVAGAGVVPSFEGAFLPQNREVDTDKLTFKANYYQNNLSTGNAVVRVDKYSGSLKGFTINVSDTSLSYVLIERLTKYVLLFIAMTYVSVLAFEIGSQRMVSLVQYVVIGAALILFYLVLLALSEHTTFTISYIAAALLMSSMIALYLKAVFDSVKEAVCVFLLLLAMYLVLYAIVHIEAYALLVGTGLLVVMLGIVMYITRRLNSKGFAH